MLRTVEASTYIKAPRRLAFAILVGYEHYRDWIPEVLESRRLANEGDVAIAEFVAPLYSNGKFVLEFVASRDDSLIYNQVDRYRRDGLSGRWGLEEADSGAGVVVHASMSLTNSLLKLGSRRRMREVLERTLEALAARSLRLAAHGAADGGLGKRKIFELVRNADGLTLDFAGTTYDLVARTGGDAG